MKRHGTIVGLCLLALAGSVALPTLADSAERARGEESGSSRFATTRTLVEPLLWTQVGAGNGPIHAPNVLNPEGYANGDLWPVVVESNRAPHYPWVVWSRFTGTNYDLAWSRWDGQGWTAIRWVEARESACDELDPDLAFDQRGRPFITWWSEGVGGRGRVFISVNLNGKWLTPSQVSLSKIDSRYPMIRVYDTGKIVIEYHTPRGIYQQGLVFMERTSITDDIDPHFQLEGEAEIVGQPLTGED